MCLEVFVWYVSYSSGPLLTVSIGIQDKLHERIKHLEDEKSLWLQNVVCIDGFLVNIGSWGKGDCCVHFAHRQHIQNLIIVCILLYSYIRHQNLLWVYRFQKLSGIPNFPKTFFYRQFSNLSHISPHPPQHTHNSQHAGFIFFWVVWGEWEGVPRKV
jgi:hypothetical protein